MNFDNQLHAFRTFLGMPPDTGDAPACGKAITRDYGVHVKPTERCRECDRLVAIAQAAAKKSCRDHR